MLTQWYEPEPGPAMTISVVARELAGRGHDVHVLTGFPNYPTGLVADGYCQRPLLREDIGGVDVIRVPLIPSHDHSAVRRIVNYASFSLSASAIGVPNFPAVDALWVGFSPITLSLPTWCLQLARGTPTVCFVGDLWPDTIAVSGLTGAGVVLRVGWAAIDRWCRAMYASSDAVVYISPSVGDVLAGRGVPRSKLRYIPVSTDERSFHPGGRSMRADLGIDPNAVVVLYAGTMGGAQGLDALIDAAALVDDERLVVLLAGSGTQEADIRRRATAPAVRFIGRVPQERMIDLMATCDISFVSLVDHPLSNATMPSKTQSALAAGRPVLAASAGDLHQLVERRGVGLTARPGDPESIAAALHSALELGQEGLARLGERAREVYLDEFSVTHVSSRMEDLLGAVARRRRKGLVRTRPAMGQ
ncbi:MAG TPA: glycosyltransferase family 4 protein [Actinomycetaceae bacterium]|nr:glycosyltransferase family 4 protein [Actinomycetaceae bacterium]